MDSLSSSFLQKHALHHSLPPPPPLRLLQLKISSVKIDEQYTKVPHLTKIFIRAQPKTTQTIRRRRRKNDFLTIFFNSLEDFICKFMDSPLRPSIDPNHVLSGNFAPVKELPPTACSVVSGSLPPSLNGAYIRNGPNPQFFPRGPYHLFDGDGMLHFITISDGEATLCSRFVKTYKYNLEREIGSPVIPNAFSAFNGLPASLARCAVTIGRVLARQYDPRRGIGAANTSLALIEGKLFALCESDLPYRIKLTPGGDIITLGRHESFGEPFMTMTAHPKIDADTGEAFAFRHSIFPPFLTYFRINAEGIKQPEIPIFSLNKASLIHDFAVTKNYAVFPDTQVLMEPREILKGRPPFRVDPEKVPRMGIIPRYAADEREMWWIEVPGCNIMHAVNAWEEDGGDTILMVAPNILEVEHSLERMDLIRASLERIEINVKKKTVRRRAVATGNLDFAVINPAYVGKKNRYVYAAVGSPMPKIGGVVKIDLSLSTTDSGDCTVASHLYPPGCYGGEPFFVAKEPDNPAAEEDDGYLVTYLHNENVEESKFMVMDAKSPTLEIIAAVKLPRRVPYGFHGIFVPECDIKRL
ncbi:Beta, beta-carotene 15,15'-dioxygenase [Handroanthus impetiginosus]|uniref:Beta, beta-carotene 15,15'-dioxygenase n=1 Tax=Handroanthus impetiginosus TaxID=429701 RepID=A0A2G9G6Y7_9LAMI|nr:Beta, beta-carotene 15,15'-dioxygenase [Handroanthus impetiginosus]